MKKSGYKIGDRVMFDGQPGWFRCRVIGIKPHEYIIAPIVPTNGRILSCSGPGSAGLPGPVEYVWQGEPEVVVSRRRRLSVTARLRPEPALELEVAKQVLISEGAVEIKRFELTYVAVRPHREDSKAHAVAVLQWDFDSLLWHILDWTDSQPSR